jgi:uncharacterized membrane protein
MWIIHWVCADSRRRFLFSLVAAAAVLAGMYHRFSLAISALSAWDSFATVVSLLAWTAIAVTPQENLRAHAKMQDFGRFLIFTFVVAAACVALFSLAILLRSRHGDTRNGVTMPVLLALGTVGVSWILLHTVYSLHYAHVFYGDAEYGEGMHGGLQFPGEDTPDYFDFAYFSFVIGMTCQVSDVQVTSQRMRRLTLIHGMIAFAFNTFIVALLINTLSGLF